MISLLIDWCARNSFLVFTGTLLLVFAGIWSIKNIPLDALPDISDVQVIVHIPVGGAAAEHHRRSGHLSHRVYTPCCSACQSRSGANHVRRFLHLRCF